MHESTLREILLVKAIEEADQDGRVLPHADRAAATREAMREADGVGAAAAFLRLRAQRLFAPLAGRQPVLAAVLVRADVPWWLWLGVVVAAFVLGVALPTLDGRQRIDLLALPFLGMLLWNVAVYLTLAIAGLRRSRPDPGLARWIAPRLGRLLVRMPGAAPGSGAADATAIGGALGGAMTAAMPRFASDFGTAAAALLAQHARRLLHLAAAAMALGLIAGLYLRGSVLRFDAGWESTFLGPAQVSTLIDLLYGWPARWLGIELPQGLAAIEALRWDQGGVIAAPWIHMIALALLVVVVVPRLLLALRASLAGWRLARTAPVPAFLHEYAAALQLRAGVVAPASAAQTINLCLISHTNVGKTTLARTLLRRDVGEVRDAPHVTLRATAYELMATPTGDLLQLWDTPGFGDSERLAARLARSEDALGWFLTQLWDRWTDREFYLNQVALRSLRDSADVVLYLVDAQETGTSIDAELQVLGWTGRPVLVLLNQLGAPKSPEAERADTERWSQRMGRHACVRATLAFDAFARCWVQEHTLLAQVAAVLPEARQVPFERLASAWRQRNEATLQQSAAVLATQLIGIAADAERVPLRGIAATTRDWLGSVVSGSREIGPFDTAMQVLATRVSAQVAAATERLLQLHGLSGDVAAEIDSRVRTDFAVSTAAEPGKAGIVGAAISGALGGLAADLAVGGLSFGAGALIGGVLGAAGARGLTHAYNQQRGMDASSVRWSEEFLRRLAASLLLRYLAVAHYGRGRGDYVASEYPGHWPATVDAALASERPALTELMQSSADLLGGLARTARLQILIESMLLTVLRQLYPDSPVADAEGT